MITTILAAAALLAADAAAVTLQAGPQLCEAEVPADAAGLEWRENWLVNTGGTDNLFVLCPMPKSLSSNRIDITVTFVSVSGDSYDLQCDFTEYAPTGGLVQRISRFATVTGQEPGLVRLENFEFDSISSQLSLRCLLPPQAAMTRLTFTLESL